MPNMRLKNNTLYLYLFLKEWKKGRWSILNSLIQPQNGKKLRISVVVLLNDNMHINFKLIVLLLNVSVVRWWQSFLIQISFLPLHHVCIQQFHLQTENFRNIVFGESWSKVCAKANNYMLHIYFFVMTVVMLSVFCFL